MDNPLLNAVLKLPAEEQMTLLYHLEDELRDYFRRNLTSTRVTKAAFAKLVPVWNSSVRVFRAVLERNVKEWDKAAEIWSSLIPKDANLSNPMVVNILGAAYMALKTECDVLDVMESQDGPSLREALREYPLLCEKCLHPATPSNWPIPDCNC